MGKLIVKRRPSRSPQVGDMRDKVSLYTRDIKTPSFGSANFDQLYTLIATVWTSIETIDAPIIFDEVDTEQKVSIEFKIRYNSQVTTETIAQFDGSNYKILEPPDKDKRKRFMFLRCALIGDKDLKVNQ